MRQRSPYEDRSHERRAIVDALQLLEWYRYTTPPWRYRESIDDIQGLLCDKLTAPYEPLDTDVRHKIVVT